MLHHLLKPFAFIVLLSTLSWPATAETVTAGNLVIVDPWARATIGLRRPGAVFVTIRNQGSAGDVLSAIETPLAERAEVHRSQISNGIASMMLAGPVEIPSLGEVRLAPGGLHVMLMKLSKPLIKGEKFSLTLVFKNTGRVEISVPVLSLGALGPRK